MHTLYNLETQIPTFFHIAYCMMVVVREKMNIERPINEKPQIVSTSLTDTTTLKDLVAKPNYNIVNELDGSTEPTLF